VAKIMAGGKEGENQGASGVVLLKMFLGGGLKRTMVAQGVEYDVYNDSKGGTTAPL